MIIYHDRDLHTGSWQTINWLAVAISILFILLTQLSPTGHTQLAFDNAGCSDEPATKRELTTVSTLAAREQRDQRCALHSMH